MPVDQRLVHAGIGAADPTAGPGWSSKTLREVNPYYWATKFGANGNWPTYEVHSS